jgi:hypothetical protein
MNISQQVNAIIKDVGGDMRSKFSYWLFIGISVGIVLGTAFNNIGCGICLGVGCSAIITLLLNEYNSENA